MKRLKKWDRVGKLRVLEQHGKFRIRQLLCICDCGDTAIRSETILIRALESGTPEGCNDCRRKEQKRIRREAVRDTFSVLENRSPVFRARLELSHHRTAKKCKGCYDLAHARPDNAGCPGCGWDSSGRNHKTQQQAAEAAQ